MPADINSEEFKNFERELEEKQLNQRPVYVDMPKVDLFGLTANSQNNKGVTMISTDSLMHYLNHPFTLYIGERYDDMVNSIKDNGIITPLIVRPKDSEKYEILAGHNRYECGKRAGLSSFPCVIRECSDEEAELIVTITNLHQRSLEDLKPSEKAKAIKEYYEAIKRQGKRRDLIEEVRELLGECESFNTTSRHSGEKLNSDESVSSKYDLSPRNISRLLRIAELIDDLSDMLDTDKIGSLACVALSYLNPHRQKSVYEYLIENNKKLTTAQAEEIRRVSENNEEDDVFTLSFPCVFEDKETKLKEKENKPATTFKLKRKSFSHYFDQGYFKEDATEKEIEKTIKKALDLYFANNNNQEGEASD